VVRTVKADGQLYTMRNQHGIPYRLRHASVPARNRRRKATRYEPKTCAGLLAFILWCSLFNWLQQ